LHQLEEFHFIASCFQLLGILSQTCNFYFYLSIFLCLAPPLPGDSTLPVFHSTSTVGWFAALSYSFCSEAFFCAPLLSLFSLAYSVVIKKESTDGKTKTIDKKESIVGNVVTYSLLLLLIIAIVIFVRKVYKAYTV
jgi:hypothetical protein